MAPLVIALQVDRGAASALEAPAAELGVSVEERGAADGLRRLEEAPADVEAVVVGAAAEAPVRTAQRVYALAPQLPVLILADAARWEHVRRALQLAPFVSGASCCVPADEPEALAQALRDSVARLRQRLAHRQALAALNARISTPPVAADPPEAQILGGILDHAPVGVVTTDARGVVRAWNARAAAILGRSERDALGAELPGLFPAGAAPRWASLLEGAAAGGAVSAEVFERPRAGGEASQHVEVTASALPGRNGDIGVLLMLQDVTERVVLLDELRGAVRARDDFLSIASHELRTPLTSMRLQVDGLAQSGARLPPEKILARAKNVARNLDRLERLVESLLDVSRISAGRLEIVADEVDYTAVVRETVERFAPECARAGCEVAVTAPDALPGRWDRMRLEQIITNLLTNAIKYGAGRPVAITLSADDRHARLVVRDHGIGIAREQQERIFGRFERAVSASNYGGLGLGLWIVRQIVLAHGGTIAVESAPEQGATFVVELPR